MIALIAELLCEESSNVTHPSYLKNWKRGATTPAPSWLYPVIWGGASDHHNGYTNVDNCLNIYAPGNFYEMSS